MSSLHILYASSSGHTELVIETLAAYVRKKKRGLDVQVTRIEQAKPADLTKGGVTLLACGTWNTGGVEGQLQPYMHQFLLKFAKDVDLKQQPCACIGLGDERYRYTAAAADHLEQYVVSHGGELVVPTLRVINEPYGQENVVERWADLLLKAAFSNKK